MWDARRIDFSRDVELIAGEADAEAVHAETGGAEGADAEGGGAGWPEPSEDQGISFHCSHLNLLRLTLLSSFYAEVIVCL